jgi:heme/copper-type cytochrome/quinol oxidase subunit 4
MKLNRRGEIVFAISLIVTVVITLIGFMWVVDHINWVGDHYCFKSSIECYFPTEGNK